ncbi:hypothetical protein HGRIS_013812 [Hohenbuehelia grisea]|uniref:Uncharacterized protein n=1 Tax=Hohenbuehelia grisea TaxID=104357 RepID=A0ABR3IWW4_9AGAR
MPFDIPDGPAKATVLTIIFLNFVNIIARYIVRRTSSATPTTNNRESTRTPERPTLFESALSLNWAMERFSVVLYTGGDGLHALAARLTDYRAARGPGLPVTTLDAPAERHRLRHLKRRLGRGFEKVMDTVQRAYEEIINAAATIGGG